MSWHLKWSGNGNERRKSRSDVLSDVAILANKRESPVEKTQEKREIGSIAVVTVFQLLAARATVKLPAGEQPAAERASPAPSSASASPAVSRQATAHTLLHHRAKIEKPNLRTW